MSRCIFFGGGAPSTEGCKKLKPFLAAASSSAGAATFSNGHVTQMWCSI